MRIMFSIAGLLVVLAIIGFTVKKQLNSLAPPSSPPASATADNGAATTPITSPPQQRVQQVQDEVQRALEQGAARASEADR